MTEQPIKMTKQEINDIGLMIDFNPATDYKEQFVVTILDQKYLVYDRYCKNPECSCSDSTCDFVEIEDDECTDRILELVRYDYKKKRVLESKSKISPEFEAALVEDELFNNMLEHRHLRVKLAFAKWQKQYFEKENALLRKNGAKIGRNDPCFCGSGKKYKKCCGN